MLQKSQKCNLTLTISPNCPGNKNLHLVILFFLGVIISIFPRSAYYKDGRTDSEKCYNDNHTIIGVWRLFVCSKITQPFMDRSALNFQNGSRQTQGPKDQVTP